jgi:Tfp pilus assembly protein PilV
MRARISAEDGMGLIELLAAMLIVTIALLVLVAGYDSAALSLYDSGRQTTASSLANQQMELYQSLPFASLGLDETTVDAIGNSTNGAYDSLYTNNSILDGGYVTDPGTGVVTQLPSGTVNDVTISGCGSTPQCSPVQNVTAPDGHRYRIETYIVDRGWFTGIGWTLRLVTVVVQNAQLDGDPEIMQLTAGFDRGPM